MTSFAEFQVLIAWDDDYAYAGTYDDITGDVIRLSTKIGFSKAFDRVPRTGTATLIIDNSDRNQHGIRRLYSPDYAAGPLYGDLLPAKRVKITATFNAVEYPIFLGYVERVDPIDDRRVRIDCVDGVDILRAQYASISTQIDRRSDQIIRTLTEKGAPPQAVERSFQIGDPVYGILGVTTTLADIDSGYDLDEGKFTAEYAGDTWHPGQTRIMEAIEDVAQAEWGRFWVEPDGVYKFWNREHELLDRTNHLSLNGDLMDMDLRHEKRNIVNRCRVTITPRRLGASDTVLARSERAIRQIRPGDTRVVRLQLANELGGVNIGVFSVRPPVANVDYQATSERHGAGQDMTGILVVSMEVKGSEVEITIRHPGSKAAGKKSIYTQSAFLSKIQVRGIPLLQYDPISAVSEDAASLSQFLAHEKTIRVDLVNDADFAQSLADQQIRQFKEIRPIVSRVTLINSDDTIYTQMLSRSIMDLIDITEEDSGLAGEEVRIISIAHTVENGEHQAVWGLEPRLYRGAVWILGETGYSELGETTILAPF